jgi:uncharacterized glyoxalase superfamily protein PhnB
MVGIEKVAIVTVAVADQDEALRWFTEKLGFVKRMDWPGSNTRFLTVSTEEQPDLQLVLASWFPDHVGKNAPIVLHTADCRQTFELLKQRGVEFTNAPEAKPWGIQAVFKDLYGNSYALVQPGARAQA